MPHQIHKGKGPLAGHSRTKKLLDKGKKVVKGVKTGFQMGGAAYKNLVKGKNPVKAALKVQNKAKVENKFGEKNKKKIAKGGTVTKAQRLAQSRIASGKTIKDVKAENTKSMKDAAKKRNEAFKKTGKSTIEQRRAAAKKKMQDAARKRNEAFKKKRAKK